MSDEQAKKARCIVSSWSDWRNSSYSDGGGVALIDSTYGQIKREAKARDLTRSPEEDAHCTKVAGRAALDKLGLYAPDSDRNVRLNALYEPDGTWYVCTVDVPGKPDIAAPAKTAYDIYLSDLTEGYPQVSFEEFQALVD